MRPVGYGLPWWLDTERYLSAEEVRALRFDLLLAVCPVCRTRPATDKAHVVRKGMGGTRHEGPRVALCRECHTGRDGLDRQERWAIAVRRSDLALVVVTRDGFERPLI